MEVVADSTIEEHFGVVTRGEAAETEGGGGEENRIYFLLRIESNVQNELSSIVIGVEEDI